MRTDMRKIISILTPVFLHQALSLAAAFLFRVFEAQYGLKYDATLVVLIGNLAVIPPAVRMYRNDGQSMGRLRECTGKTDKAWADETAAATRISASKTERTAESPAEGTVRRQILFGVCCFAAGGVLNVVWSSVLSFLQIQTHFSNQVQEQMFASSFIVQLIGLGVVAPIAEELVFRGLTYRRMRQIFPLWASVCLSAILFAVYHGNPIQMFFAFPLAIVLALLFEHGKLFVFPVLFHMGSNLTAIFLQILFHG